MNCIKVWNKNNIRVRTSDRYVSITDMAQADGKLLADWARLKTTESYLSTLSLVMGIPITSDSDGSEALLYITKGGNQEQGTWAHPKVAIRFAQWCSDEFAIQVDSWVEELLRTGTVSVNQDLQLERLVSIANLAIDMSFGTLNLKPELISGLKLNATIELVPELAKALEPARQMLINSTAQELELLTVTQIGKQLELSAIKVNKLLVEKGLQIKNPRKTSKKDSAYIPAGQGLEFSDLTLATGNGKDNTTYQQLRWYPSVIDLLVS
jgi:KilA-N domain